MKLLKDYLLIQPIKEETESAFEDVSADDNHTEFVKKGVVVLIGEEAEEKYLGQTVLYSDISTRRHDYGDLTGEIVSQKALIAIEG